MIELQGKYNTAKVFADNIDESAISQIIELCNQEFAKESRIAIMADVHAGKGSTIGTSMTIKDKVVPNLVGVDIGCGMLCIRLNEKDVDFAKLDEVIRSNVPFGQSIRNNNHRFLKRVNFKDLRCKNILAMDRIEKSLGSLGGGNHFLELASNEDGELFLIIHTGSRYLGKQVAEYYQGLAVKQCEVDKSEREELISKLKLEGAEKEISIELAKLKQKKVVKHLAYLEGESLNDYLHDIQIVQEYAMQNRLAIADEIVNGMGFSVKDSFSTIHNYIDVDNMILRKGAISAQKDEVVLIPINMRDGSIIAIGKGNPDYNYSGPHGAGRIASRGEIKNMVSMQEYISEMEGVWSTSVVESTLDESPMAYKPIDSILDNIKDTVDVLGIIKPLYNFKASKM